MLKEQGGYEAIKRDKTRCESAKEREERELYAEEASKEEKEGEQSKGEGTTWAFILSVPYPSTVS